MAQVEIRLLGPFEVAVDGEPVTTFETDSVRALLAYLATQSGHPRPRSQVAELLWPDRPDGAALSNLRHALSVLRTALRDRGSAHPVLIADRVSVALRASADIWVDLVEFDRRAATPADDPQAVARWRDAVDLWRGPLLDGVTVRAGADWEEWVAVTGEGARRRLAAVLRRLAEHHEREGEVELAIPIARRLAEIDPWNERAHRQLMGLLVRAGNPAEALSHFSDLQDRLRHELGIAPSPETSALAGRIRAGDRTGIAPVVEVARPGYLDRTVTTLHPRFVDRRPQLEQLRRHLDAAIAGRGRMVFVAGEAGSGKTMLARELLRRAMAVPDLLAARGRCNAFAGVGDPYLPFRELLSQLTGEVEAGYATGTLDRDQATRLWDAIPHAARLLSELGPGLVGVMVNGGLLLERLEQARPGAPEPDAVQRRIAALVAGPATTDRPQPALFDEYTAVLERLAVMHPLLLVVDDLQWADRGSIALLWHLARRLEGSRVLLVVAYRPEDVLMARDAPVSLDAVLRELHAQTPGRVVEVGSDRAFIDAFLDTEPNALDEDFRERLFASTAGHALFTAELVRDLQERAALRRDRAGVWRLGGSLAWDRLPSRVEAAIARRIGRLPDQLRRDLVAASVQGETFVAEVVAAVRGDPGATTRLSEASGTAPRLIEPPTATRVGDRLLAHHRFRHGLFQRYLYDRLDGAERARLHEATGRALEDLYGEHPELPLVELAHHFDEAGLGEPAIRYLDLAARRALQMSAAEEAIPLLERADALLAGLPRSRQRDELELALLGALFAAFMSARGYAAPGAEPLLPRVRELCDRLPPSPATALALLGLSSVTGVRGRYQDATATAEEAMAICDALGDPALRVAASGRLGYLQTWTGDLAAGHANLQRAHHAYDPDRHGWLMAALGSAEGPDALAWDALNTLLRGYPDQSRELADRAIEVARALGHPFTLCLVLGIAGVVVRHMNGDYRTGAVIDEIELIARSEHFPFYEAAVEVYRGEAAGHTGDLRAGIDRLTRGLEAWEVIGVGAWRGAFLATIAWFEHASGGTHRASDTIHRGCVEARRCGEVPSEVIALLLRGRILADSDATAAIDALTESLDLARRRGIRLLELRVATELAELHRRGGDPHLAETVLAPVYAGFTEGFDSPYLTAARELLDRR